MRRFFYKSNIDKILSIFEKGGSALILLCLLVLAGCHNKVAPKVNTEAAKAKIEFVQPANGSLTAKVENGNAISSGEFFSEGTKIIFTALPKAGYQVDSWENAVATNADKTQAELTVGKTAVKVKVRLSVIPPQPATDGIITFSAGEHGSIKATIDGVEIVSGTKQSANKEIIFTATPENGYKVANWEPDENDTIKLRSTDIKDVGVHTVKGDVTIRVNFAPLAKCRITFSKDASVPGAVTITATAGEGATARPINSGEEINQGERIEFNASGFDVAEYEAVWTVKRGGTPMKAPFHKNPLTFPGTFTLDGRDIDVVLKIEKKITAKVVDSTKDEITVVGKTNVENAQPQFVYIKLTNDTFKTDVVTTCYDVTSWFTNLPRGLTVKTDCNANAMLDSTKTKLKVQFFGVPTEAKDEAIKVTIPKKCLTSGRRITAEINESAKFSFTEGFPVTAESSISFTGVDSITLNPDAKITVRYNPSAKIYVIAIADCINSLPDKTSYTVKCKFTVKGSVTNATTEVSARINKNGDKFVASITALIPEADIKDASTVSAEIIVTKK